MRLMRTGVVVLAVVGIAGTAAELAAARHWGLPVQFVPWVSLALLALALVLLGLLRRRAAALVRVIGVLVLGASGFGVYMHLATNLAAGAATRPDWAQLPPSTQWWLAASQSVGDTPPFAAGALGYAAALVLLATVGLRRPAPAQVQDTEPLPVAD
ncbi:MAG: hypothetical protein ACT4RN_10490 [Pseudonocardia sp.]